MLSAITNLSAKTNKFVFCRNAS